MKTILVFVSLALCGCSSLPSILEKSIPDGKWEKMNATVNGKFSATTITGEDVDKKGKQITAKNLHVRHSNVWVPLIEFEGTGFLATPPTPVTP